jgi:DNA-directed RNA polymerase beta' subunit
MYNSATVQGGRNLYTNAGRGGRAGRGRGTTTTLTRALPIEDPEQRMTDAFVENIRLIRQSISELPVYNIEGISWRLLTQAESISPDLVSITNPLLKEDSSSRDQFNSVYDSRLGSANSASKVCTKCGLNNCNGHSGKIEFPDNIRIMHHDYIGAIIKVLSCVCFYDGQLLLPKADAERISARGATTGEKLKHLALASKDLNCSRINCNHPAGLSIVRHKYALQDSEKAGLLKTDIITPTDTKRDWLTGMEVERAFRRISQETLEILGYKNIEDLCAYCVRSVVVTPVNLRNFTVSGNRVNHHPDTVAFASLVRVNETLKAAVRFHNVCDSLKEITGADVVDITTFASVVKRAEANLAQQNDRYGNDQSQYSQNIAIFEKRQALLTDADPDYLIKSTDIYKGIQQQKELAKSREIEFTKLKTHHSIIIQAANEVALPDSNSLDITVLSGALFTATTAVYKLMLEKYKGKRGDFRRTMMGKNSEFTARAVASPSDGLDIDQVGVPREICRYLGRRITVDTTNMAEINILLSLQKIIGYIRDGEPHEITAAHLHSGKLHFRPGDVVIRMLQDEDIIVMGRQPTLHLNNMLGFRVKVQETSLSIQVHMIWTTGFNLDFDGDEVNLYVPQSPEAIEEARTTMYSTNNLISPRSSRPITGAVYNALSAWYLATRVQRSVTEQTWNQALMILRNRDQLPTLNDRLQRHGLWIRNGHAIFSMLLPANFNYPDSSQESSHGVRIEEGIFTAGLLDEKTLAPDATYSINQAIYNNYPRDIMVNYLNDLYNISIILQQEQAQTVSYTDCAFGVTPIPEVTRSYERQFLTLTTEEQEKFLEQKGYTNVKKIVADYQRTQRLNLVESPLEVEKNNKIKVAELQIKLLPPPTSEYDLIHERKVSNILSTIGDTRGVMIVKGYHDARNQIHDVIDALMKGVAIHTATDNISLAARRLQLLHVFEDNIITISTRLNNAGPNQKDLDLMDIMLKLADDPVFIRQPLYQLFREYDSNNLFDMGGKSIGSGAKGGPGNFSMIGSSVGQQTIAGSTKVPNYLTNGTRTLSSTLPGETDLAARGFITNSYFDGLNPQEKLMEGIGARYGIAGTATSTSVAGDLNTKLCKAMENIIVGPEGDMRHQSGMMFDSFYGFDSRSMILVDNVATFCNVSTLTDMINHEEGWSLHTPQNVTLGYKYNMSTLSNEVLSKYANDFVFPVNHLSDIGDSNLYDDTHTA